MYLNYSDAEYSKHTMDQLSPLFSVLSSSAAYPYKFQDKSVTLDIKGTKAPLYVDYAGAAKNIVDLSIYNPIPDENWFIQRIPSAIRWHIVESSYHSRDPYLYKWRIIPDMREALMHFLIIFLHKRGLLLFKRKGVWYLADNDFTFYHKVEINEWYSLCGAYTYEEKPRTDKRSVEYSIRYLDSGYKPLLKHCKYEFASVL